MNVIDLPETEKNTNTAALEALKRNLPVILEYAALQAQIKRTNYLAFLKEGFTEAQALELVKG